MSCSVQAVGCPVRRVWVPDLVRGASSCRPSPSPICWSCPELPRPRPRRSAGGASHHRAIGLRGRGVPGPARVRGRQPDRPRPVRAHGPDGRGRVRAGRAQGHPVAPAPRLRDRHVHHRRGVQAPGLERRRRPHHQRRHPVDDGRRRHPAHRGAAGGASGFRWPVPRLPALGQPAVAAEDDPAALPGHPGPPGRAADLGRRGRAAAGHRRSLDGHSGPGVTHTPIFAGARDCFAWR